MQARLRRLPFQASAYLFFLAAAVIVTWPLAAVMASRYAGHPFSDTYEYVHHIWWLNTAIRTGQPLFFQPLLGFPDGIESTWLWTAPLQSFPAWLLAFVLPLPVAFNLVVLLQLALNGWAMFFLARHLTGHALPALVAGAIFLAYPTFQAHLGAGHTGLLALWPMPLYVYALFRLRETPHRRWIAIGAALFVLSTLGNIQLLIFMTLPVTALFVLVLLARREWRALRHAAVLALLGALAVLPFAVPQFLATRGEPAYLRPAAGIVGYSADPRAILSPSFYHPLFQHNALSRSILGMDPFENTAYMGIVAGALSMIGVIARRGARWWLLVAAVAWVFSLGPLLKLGVTPATAQFDGHATHITLPWAALYNLPLVNMVRTPGRFNFLIALAVAAMAGYGAGVLWNALRPRPWLRPLIGILTALVILEYLVFWEAGRPAPAFPTIPAAVPTAIATLAARDDVRAVLDLPWNHLVAAKEGMWLQTAHQQPLVAGHITRVTPVHPARLAILQQTLDYALLDAAGVDVVILHREWDDAEGILETFVRQRLGEPRYEDSRFAVFDVPEPETVPAFVALPAPENILAAQADSYVYLPRPGAVLLRATLAASNRDVLVLVDGVPAQRWTIDGAADIEFWTPLEAGYHLLTLAVDPPCPPTQPPGLECSSVRVSGLQIIDATQGES